VRFQVHVQPRAARSEIVGMHGEAIKIRLTSPPVDDAANEELIALLARELGITRGAVRIVSGSRARSKVVEVVGTSIDRVRQLATKDIAR
jgi:uncharacterized protein (TIGR00251 family)